MLAGLTRQQRVAQLFLVGVPLERLDEGDALARQGVGGVFLHGRSTLSTASLAGFTRRWVGEAPGLRPWVAVDQEGGTVQSLSGSGFTRLPTARDQGQFATSALAAMAQGMGASLAAAGVSLDLAPVADAVPKGREAQNAPIGAFRRQYGSDPDVVAAAADVVLCGLRTHGVTGALKHFPGLVLQP